MKTLPDIVGNNAVHALGGGATILATSVYICAVGGPARLGDLANVGAARGASLETGKMTILPPKAGGLDGYQIAAFGAYVPNGTTLTISYDD